VCTDLRHIAVGDVAAHIKEEGMRKLYLLLFVLVALLATVATAAAGGRPFSTTLSGAEEVNAQGVPNQGDPDGSGFVRLTLNPGQGEICFELTVTGIAPATAAHIHVGAAGTAPPNNVVVALTPPPTSGSSSDCESVDRELVKAILQNPENYYVNVHNADFPAGAVRGQLSK
jgi:hypothetical protein